MGPKRAWLPGFAALALLCTVGVAVLRLDRQPGLEPRPQRSQPEQAEPQIVANYGKLPLSFEANLGQVDSGVKFLSRGSGYTLFLAGKGEGISGPVAVAVSGDNRQIVIANSQPGSVAQVDISNGTVTAVPCECAVVGLQRLDGNAVFRLTEASEGLVRVFDGDAAEPRIVLVPGDGRPRGGRGIHRPPAARPDMELPVHRGSP